MSDKWEFIVPDSARMLNGKWYTARIDEPQKEWVIRRVGRYAEKYTCDDRIAYSNPVGLYV